MKISKISLIVIVAIIAIIGVAVLNNKPAPKIKTAIIPTSTPTATPTVTSTPTPITVSATPTSIYSAAVKAKVRAEFIATCNTRGHYSISICNCVADYLSKNYSEAKLAQIYVEYHATSKIPGELETAYNGCAAKK